MNLQIMSQITSMLQPLTATTPPLMQGLLGNPVIKAGLISGSMSVLGDALAQLLTLRTRQVNVLWGEGDFVWLAQSTHLAKQYRCEVPRIQRPYDQA